MYTVCYIPVNLYSFVLLLNTFKIITVNTVSICYTSVCLVIIEGGGGREGGILVTESSDGMVVDRSVGEMLCLKLLPLFSNHVNET